MGDAIGQVLALAVGVALSPLPIVAVVLMLVTPRARVNGPMFVLGWVIGLGIIGTLVLALAGPADATDDSGPATWVGVVELVLGALLLLLAVRQWRTRQHGDAEAAMPKWMNAIDTFTPVKALGAGMLLSGLNPKNLLLSVAAATAIAQTDVSGNEQAIAYAVFAVIATLGVAAPVVLFFALGDRSGAVLDRLKTWMARNNTTILAVLLLIIGAKVIGDGISALSD